MTPISFCCVTFNAERTLNTTLASLAGVADEIIIVDSFSTDATMEIARRYTSKVVQEPYLYHGTQMNKATALATHDWVFCIDADESLDEELVKTLKEWKEKGPGDRDSFRVWREWLFLGRSLHAFYPVSSPDRIIRLYNRQLVRFNDRPVDDKPEGQKKIGKPPLAGLLKHDTTGSIHDLFAKCNHYSSRAARGAGPEAVADSSLGKVVLRPWGAVAKWYLLKQGYKDGFPGLLLGVYAFLYTFLKYAKMYERKINEQGGK
ncbi:glycosyltransferase involved in cell wall biosynthesis [Prosthecobacter fusiformis]|uniref:Glycosyltransferase involved in cell wall biosynthesis n=1 Tax=Prosthecobacter fusiformis TaxID=48464 RepID=A0A4R7SRN3_9BACT|nr:glycosyltransferase family 2 protein [Prosthecobacter fusiformis]TDU81771.1 glycosyltransferase involved in cell wall biosynthesis [Prosthecobacter fusiformis]